MSDEFIEVEERGLGDNLLASIKGIATGGILFLLSFPVLWWNEGRTDMSEVAQQAKMANPSAVDKGLDGKLIAVTGPLKGGEKISDKLLLKPGDYLELRRVVEQFSWVEETESKTEKKLGGGSRTTKVTRYERGWSSSPMPPEKMKDPVGHRNPPLLLEGGTYYPSKASVGVYRFDPKAAQLPGSEPLTLTPDLIEEEALASAKSDAAKADDAAKPADDDGAGKALKEGAADDKEDAAPKKKAKKRKHHGRKVRRTIVRDSNPAPVVSDKPMPSSYKLAGNYLFRGRGTAEDPQVGDVRVSFRALPPGGEVTLYGAQSGEEVRAFVTKKGDSLYRVAKGGHQEAVAGMAAEHKMMTWILRFVGFLMMWIGLSMFFGPVNAVLDIVPFLGSMGRFLVGLVLLPVSVVLSIFVILLSIVAHSPILLVLTLAAIIGGGYFLYQKRRKRAAPPTPPPAPSF